LRFRCALGAARFHSCPGRYTPTLRVGRHLLRVLAVDPRGRTSPTTTIVVRIVKRPAGPAHSDQTFRVGSAPYNVAYGFGSLWVSVEAALVRLDPATGAVQARVAVGGRPWGIAIAKSVVWVGNQFNETIAAVDPHTNAVARQIVLDGAAPVAVAVGGGASGPRATSTTASGALIPRRARFSALRASATVTSSSAIAKAASGSRVRTARPRNSMRRREP
jgi:streptogramin lyase